MESKTKRKRYSEPGEFGKKLRTGRAKRQVLRKIKIIALGEQRKLSEES